MKKILGFIFLAVFILTIVSIPLTSFGFEIQEPIKISRVNPRFICGGAVWKDTVKIRAIEIESSKGGYARLATNRKSEDKYALSIYVVPKDMSIREAMPYINSCPLYGVIEGNEYTYLPPGRYVYVLTSSLPYPDKRTEDPLANETQILISAKLNGD